MKRIILTTTILLLTISSVFSQTSEVGKKYIYEFRDGTTIIGTYDRSEEGNIYIKDLEGEEVYIPKVMVAQIHEVTDDNIKNGEYWFPNLHDSRYFFSPSAFGLREGEGYFGHSYWALWQTQYGITDDFSIGAGVIGWMPITINAKYSFNIKNDINAAMGWFYVGDLLNLSEINDEMGSLINMPYAVVTKGTRENNVTLGMGYNLSSPFKDIREDNELETESLLSEERLVLNVGGTFRTARRFSLVFEGWIFNGDGEFEFMGGPGIRYFRKINRVTAKNGAGAKTFDIQLLRLPGMTGLQFFPMFGASQKF